jgi:imidazolonepropionase-like amidohydrolase
MTPRTALAALAAASLLALPRAAQADDLEAARAVFERNLAAIAEKDREAYLATYLHAPTLARTGPEGPSLGFEDFAAQAGDAWPEVFEAQDLRLVPVAPGVVYGIYRYRVAYRPPEGGPLDEHAGISERLFLATPEGWRIAVTSAVDAPPGTPPPPRALVGATLVDGSGAPPIPDAVVVLRGGTVECAGSRASCSVPEGVGTLDLAGRWITPGLVDAHVHFSQTGWADGRPDALDVRDRFPYPATVADLEAHPERFFRALLCSGVTAAFDVGGYPWTWDLPERAEADRGAPHVAAAGPLLTTLDHWLNLPAERQFVYLTDEASARDGVAYLAARGTDAVKVWLIVTGERPMEELAAVVAAAGEAAAERDLPLVVHATGLAEAKAALAAGARVLVHSVAEQPVDEEFLDLARRAGAFYVPTLTVPRGYLRLYRAAVEGRAPEVDDPNGCVGAETLARVAATAEVGAGGVTPARLEAMEERIAAQEGIAAANLLRVHAAGIPVALGTDAGNPLTLHGPSVHAELEAMQAAGMPAAAVVVAATRDAARAMGRPDLGLVAPGQAADLLVLGADPTADVAAFRRLEAVVRGGVVRPAGELRAPVTAAGAAGGR